MRRASSTATSRVSSMPTCSQKPHEGCISAPAADVLRASGPRSRGALLRPRSRPYVPVRARRCVLASLGARDPEARATFTEGALADREDQLEPRAAFRRHVPEVAAVRDGIRLRDRESEPRALAGYAPFEALEEPRPERLRHTFPCVFDGDP